MSKDKTKTSNKDLLSIHRMDFYKKKTDWKLTNDVKKVSSKPEVPKRDQSITSRSNVTNDRDPQENTNHKEIKDFTDALNKKDDDEEDGNQQDNNTTKEIVNLNNAFKEIDIAENKKDHNCPKELKTAVKENDFTVYQEEHDSAKELNDLKEAFIAVDAGLDPQAPDSPKELLYLNNAPKEIDSASCHMPLQQDYYPGTVGDIFILPQYPSRHYGVQVLSPEFGQYYRQAQWSQQLMECGDNVLDGITVLENSLESSAEFIRGSHCSPHSSEIELNIPNVPQSDLSNEALAHLPNKVLYSLLQQHRNMVKLLLKEANARMRFQPESLPQNNDKYSTSYISSDISARHIAPYAYPDIAERDYFLAGNSPIGRGRGRGRYNQNKQLFGLRRGRKTS